MYRHYVDKCLKKMGMQKLVIRLRDIFNCTLQRAREALESPRYTSDLRRVIVAVVQIVDVIRSKRKSFVRSFLKKRREFSMETFVLYHKINSLAIVSCQLSQYFDIWSGTLIFLAAVCC